MGVFEQEIEAVARDFAQRVTRYIGLASMQDVVERNRTAEEGICHSHDFCDANVFMAEAMEANGHVDPDPEHCDPGFAATWSDAWNVAKASGFWLEVPS